MITLPETAFIEKNIKFFIICFLLFVEGYCLGKMAEIIAETTVKIIKINKEHKN